MWSVTIATRKGIMLTNDPEIKATESKDVFKVRKAKQVDEPKSEDKVIIQIRIRYSTSKMNQRTILFIIGYKY
jgi:hypothetical protein